MSPISQQKLESIMTMFLPAVKDSILCMLDWNSDFLHDLDRLELSSETNFSTFLSYSVASAIAQTHFASSSFSQHFGQSFRLMYHIDDEIGSQKCTVSQWKQNSWVLIQIVDSFLRFEFSFHNLHQPSLMFNTSFCEQRFQTWC